MPEMMKCFVMHSIGRVGVAVPGLRSGQSAYDRDCRTSHGGLVLAEAATRIWQTGLGGLKKQVRPSI